MKPFPTEDAVAAAINSNLMVPFTVVPGTGWNVFGRSNAVLLRGGVRSVLVPGHNGEVVPGSIIEDLLPWVIEYERTGKFPFPLTAEVDATWVCRSARNCGGHCFSAAYRKGHPLSIPADLLSRLIREFAAAGGRIWRWDGGGEPMCHSQVRDGSLVREVHAAGLKQTILTSGDLFETADHDAFVESNVYLRFSLNAATAATHRRFFGDLIDFDGIVRGIAQYLRRKHASPTGALTPTGATFLLSDQNIHELVACARMARDMGFDHFSVRRVLGPSNLRPAVLEARRLEDALTAVAGLATATFVPFIPWRPIDEPDISANDIPAVRCWQSVFRMFVEPATAEDGMAMTLCGRYRGGGVGQCRQIPPAPLTAGALVDLSAVRREWVAKYEGADLLGTCPSCIDRGFILLVDDLIRAVCSLTGQIDSAYYVSVTDRSQLRYAEIP